VASTTGPDESATPPAGTGAGRVLCFATQGAGHLDEERIRALLEPLQPTPYRFDRASRLKSAIGLLRTVRRERPELVVMEGTGTAGGLALLAANVLHGVPFVVSSGDAVGPFLALHSRLLGALGQAYERLLCRRCAGYVGWTPYLAGRALTFGARRAMSAPGWTRATPAPDARGRVRSALGIPERALVVGLIGSLNWNEKAGYVYGAELVQAVRRTTREDVVVCVVGDGDGRQRLEQLAGEDLGRRVVLPGRVAPERVADHLAAFDAASLSQSVDQVGSFRYTTKLSEYLAAGLPVIAGQVPAAYDLELECFWRLPGAAPWSAVYISALAALLDGLRADELARRRAAVAAAACMPFEKHVQQRRMLAFVQDILDGAGEAEG
jgi:glycosyltransferase involved in cell wall biosynthesis